MSTPFCKVLNDTDPNRWNCVKYARARCPKLPFGLWTINDKTKIINSDKPRAGDVAIISTGFLWGHVAIVRKVGKLHVTIKEANWKAGKVTERHGTQRDLKILGYFNPLKT